MEQTPNTTEMAQQPTGPSLRDELLAHGYTEQTAKRTPNSPTYTVDLELNPAKVGTEPVLTRCEVTHTWCFCVEVGTKKVKRTQKKVRKTLDSNGKKS